jgi:hypothetical protein
MFSSLDDGPDVTAIPAGKTDGATSGAAEQLVLGEVLIEQRLGLF